MRAALLWISVVVVAATGCGGEAVPSDVDDDARAKLGGDATVHDLSRNAFGNSLPTLDDTRRARFFVGNSFFKQNWVQAPASTQARDGLGPLFNARSCSGCHQLDGRGRPPETEDEEFASILVRLSTPDGAGGLGPEPSYGGQLQPKAIGGVAPEATAHLRWREQRGSYDDGTPYSLVAPELLLGDFSLGPFAPGTLTSLRVAPPVFGLGLLEAISETTLIAHEDPSDADGDGISGRASRVQSLVTGEEALGRFGWKAGQPSVREQSAGAFLGDMGITSTLHPTQDCTAKQGDCLAAIDGGEPEIDDARLDDVVFYGLALAVPARRDVAATRRGEQLFEQSGCAKCHLGEIVTGNYDPVPELSHQTIRPFTDLLLHDMGEGLADGRPDGVADGREWRTPPLWGIGLTRTVNGHTRYLHDGRARSLEEAILWHGGEAEASRRAFTGLTASDRAALVAFLESL